MKTSEQIRDLIHDLEFNPKKCGELLLKITDLLVENKCNKLERTYITSVMQSMETNMTAVDLLSKDDNI